ncbi:hypothetical protein [Gracilimonas sp.]|uniref:hypothetical protein n=1 Tax=Gracilimonas sp. TaxID=1974203 RepID=UPI003D0F0961
MKKTNFILLICLSCLFIPYEDAIQYLSHLLLIFVVLFFYDYYKLKPILYFYGYGMLAFCVQYIFLHQDVFLANYILSLVYAPLLVLLYPSRKLDSYTIDLERIINISFLIYAILLWYQALTNWWTPESVGGVHGIIKGPHLNAQLYLLLSGYTLFKEGYKNKTYALFFLLTAILCSYNLATLVFFVSVVLVLFVNVSLNKKYFKFLSIAGVVLIVGIFTLFKIVTEMNPYLLTMLSAISTDLGYSGKIGYVINYFTDYIQQDFASFIIGTSPGNGGSRAALLLTDNFLSVSIPDALISESFFVKENVYPYLYGVSDVTRGTINQPFSSLIALISEYGIIASLFFTKYLFRFYKKLQVKNKYSHNFLIINLVIWILFSHSLELLPFIVLFHLLTLSNKIK